MDLYLKFKDGKSKALTLSYDDAKVTDIKLCSVLKKYGIKCTFNINSGRLLPGDFKREKYEGLMTVNEARDLYLDSDYEIACHSVTHSNLPYLRFNDILCEILKDRENIEKTFGVLARGMAYPFGSVSDDEVNAAEASQICYCRTVQSTGNFNIPNNWLLYNPTCHHNHPDLMNLAEMFTQNTPSWGAAWLFSLWGHSSEFETDKNWDLIEKFLQKVGNRDDIWYGTNIEIYDYVKAYHSLQTSVDNRIVFNPSAISVWVEYCNSIFEIKPGETKYL